MEFVSFLRNKELDDFGKQLVQMFNDKEITPVAFNNEERIFLVAVGNGFDFIVNCDQFHNLFVTITSKDDHICKEADMEELALLVDTFFSKDQIEVVAKELEKLLENVEKKQTTLDKIIEKVKYLYETCTEFDLLDLVRELNFIKKYKSKDPELLEDHLKFTLKDTLEDIRYLSFNVEQI